MRFWFIPGFSFLFVIYWASGAKITNNVTVVPSKTEGRKVVFQQQYIGHDAKTNEAIKKLDEKLSKKLDQIIKLLEEKNCSNQGMNF